MKAIKHMSVRLTESEADWLEREAVARDASVSSILRSAIAREIAETLIEKRIEMVNTRLQKIEAMVDTIGRHLAKAKTEKGDQP